jgi:hypothetical protein
MNFFPRPVRPQIAATQPQRQAQAAPAQAPSVWQPPRPRADATLASLVGLILTAFAVSSGGAGRPPSETASVAAIGTGCSLMLGFAFEMRAGPNNLIRADVMALLAFYFLTFFEFLFPQAMFDRMIAAESAITGIYVVIVAFAGLLVGRHLIHPKRQPFQNILTHEIPHGMLVLLFWFAFCVGYLHQWSAPAVGWSPVKWIDYSMSPRFAQPWGRGRFGDFSALLYELNMIINLVPPLAGIILARRHRFGVPALVLVLCGYLLTVFLAFAGGTRNVLATYLVTFVIGFAFAARKGRERELIAVIGSAAALLVFGTLTMIHMRTVGLKNYLSGQTASAGGKSESIYVDYNLYNIAKLTEVFPKRMPYLGFEVPYLALIRPIPRALWRGKPEGLSNSIEKALGFEGGVITISASFAGEAYMAGGMVGVLLVAIFFGAINGWWSHVMTPKISELGILIYSSGFFAAVISMRSLFTYTTALLPTVAAIVGTTYLVRYLARKVRAGGRGVSDRGPIVRGRLPVTPAKQPPGE